MLSTSTKLFTIMGKNISFRQIVADKMSGYDFESSEIADTIKAAKEQAKEYAAKIKAAQNVDECKALEINTDKIVKDLSESLTKFEYWQKKLNECLHDWIFSDLSDTLEHAVHEYGLRNNERWLTHVSLKKLGIYYTDSLCDTEARCLTALCDVLSELYDCKRTKDLAKTNKAHIHALASVRLKDMHSHYGVTLTRQLIHAILEDEKSKFAVRQEK